MNTSLRAEHIMQTMARLGFVPKSEIDTRYVEFYKDFAEPGGRVARCTVLFNKGGVVSHMGHATIANFVVTVQTTVAPIAEEVRNRAPKVLQQDLLHLIEELEGIPTPSATPTEIRPDAILCDACGQPTLEYIISEKDEKVCSKCYTAPTEE